MNEVHPKVSMPAFAGALVGIMVYELKRHGVEIDAIEASYVTLVVMTVLGFMIPSPYVEPENNPDPVPQAEIDKYLRQPTNQPQ